VFVEHHDDAAGHVEQGVHHAVAGEFLDLGGHSAAPARPAGANSVSCDGGTAFPESETIEDTSHWRHRGRAWAAPDSGRRDRQTVWIV